MASFAKYQTSLAQMQIQQAASKAKEDLDVYDTRSLHDIELETAETKFEMSTILDILKTPGFHVIWYLGLIYFWIFGILCLVPVDFGIDCGCTKDQARDLMMFQSAGEIIGRMGLTVLVDMQFISHRSMVCLNLILMTVILCVIPYYGRRLVYARGVGHEVLLQRQKRGLGGQSLD